MSLESQIDELQVANILTTAFAKNLLDFVKVANSIIHGADVPTDVKVRLTGIGMALSSSLHHKRKVLELMREFDGHLLWHVRHNRSEKDEKYHFWSAVAATLPEFDYNYDIYQEASEQHKKKLIERDHPQDAVAFYVLSLDEFVTVLEFREKELLRLIDTWHRHQGDAWDAFRKANDWQWPQSWGHIDWGGPIIREQLSVYTAEDDLMQTRNALNRYRMKLLRREPPANPPS